MLRTTSPFLLTFGIATAVIAQSPGSNDAAFNPGDHGHGTGDPIPYDNGLLGVQNRVTCAALDGNGRTLWAGWTYYPLSNSSSVLVGRRLANGSADPTFDTSQLFFFGEVDAVAVQADGKVLVGGSFFMHPITGNRKNLIRLNADGSLDTGFLDNQIWGTGTPRVRAITTLANGKILIAGSFTSYNGVAVFNMTRLNSDGTRDTTWPAGHAGGANGAIHAILIDANGDVFIGGEFTQAGGLPKGRIARFDVSEPSSWWTSAFGTVAGANGTVRTLSLQPDGAILAGGDFTTMSGSPCERIMRLSPVGALDPLFDTSPGFDASVRSLVVRNDGTIVVCGAFTAYAGTLRAKLAALGTNGALIASFDPGTGPSSTVYQVLAHADGKLTAYGAFSAWNGIYAGRHIRLTASGGIDDIWSYNGANGTVHGVAVQSDGRIIVGGGITCVNGSYRPKLTRLMPDGSIDAGFPSYPIGNTSHIDDEFYYLRDIVTQPDDKILVGGALSAYVNPSVGYGFGLVRLLANGNPDPSFHSGFTTTQAAKAISLQPDGKILASYAHIDAESYPASFPGSSFKRFNPDGTTDPSFAIGSCAVGLIEDSGLLPDGRVILVGGFTNYAGCGMDRIVRLLPDGSVDGTFTYTTGFAGGVPKHVLAFSDGTCIVSGSFTSYDGATANGLLRLDADGSFDQTFTPTVQGGGPVIRGSNGKLIVGGRYRLNADGSTDTLFDTGSGFTNASGYSDPLATTWSNGGIIAVGDFTAFNGTGRNRIARVAEVVYSDITLPVRALLEGPFVSATNLMNDGLRAAGLIPTSEPFTALGFTHVQEPITPLVSPSVFNPTIPVFGSIVDWVMVELRSATNPDSVVQTRTGLIQRDGDIVGPDGTSPLVFHQPLGNYHVAVRHRNHLGAMTASPVALSTVNAMLNFSLPTTATYGTDGQKISGTRSVLWAGDATHNGAIKYTGSGNDRDPILVKVGSTTPNAIVPGYFNEDVNMDGTVKYTGSANDRDPILVNVGSTAPNTVRQQQFP
jgi:uncharacterized delta-60 repeat protein